MNEATKKVSLEPKRFTEIVLPIPKDSIIAAGVGRETQEIIEGRAKLRDRAKAIALELQGPGAVMPGDLEALSEL